MLVKIRDTQLWVESTGRGGPLFVMHGGPGLDHTYFRPYLDCLGATCGLIYYDHRGNGRSSLVRNWDETTHSTWVEDADQLLTTLGHDKVVLFGHSYGGYIAQEFAIAHSDRIAGLILCGTAPVFDYWDIVMANARARSSDELFQFLKEGFSQPCPDDDAMSAGWHALAPLYFHRPDLYLPADPFSLIRFRAAAFNHGMFQCLPKFDVSQSICNLSIPALILGGRHDWISPPDCGAERLHALIPHSELVIFEESGHFPFIEEPEAFVRTVGSWIQRLIS